MSLLHWKSCSRGRELGTLFVHSDKLSFNLLWARKTFFNNFSVPFVIGPPVITDQSGDQISTEGKNVTVHCTGEADPRPELRVFFNGTLVVPGPNTLLSSTEIGQYGRRGELTLINVSNENTTGVYVCQAFNAYSPPANATAIVTVYSELDRFAWDN